MTADENNTSETEEETQETQQETPETGTEKTGNVAAMEAALKKANKEAEKFRRKLEEIENAGKSETDRLRDEKEAAARERDEARKDVLRLQVAISKKLPMSLAQRLQGETKEEIEADADTLLAELKPGTPSGDADAGRRGKDPDSKKDMNALLRAAAGH